MLFYGELEGGRGLPAGQRSSDSAYAKQKQSVSKPMLDFTEANAD